MPALHFNDFHILFFLLMPKFSHLAEICEAGEADESACRVSGLGAGQAARPQEARCDTFNDHNMWTRCEMDSAYETVATSGASQGHHLTGRVLQAHRDFVLRPTPTHSTYL